VANVYGETIDIRSPFFARLTDDQQILSQAILMRLSTRRGTYWSDPGYGLSVQDLLAAGLTVDALARIPAEVRAQLEQDERIRAVSVAPRVETLGVGKVRLLLDLTVTPSRGPTFSRTVAVTDLTVELLTRGSAT
jgi:phage baseplate assembly protein W